MAYRSSCLDGTWSSKLAIVFRRAMKAQCSRMLLFECTQLWSVLFVCGASTALWPGWISMEEQEEVKYGVGVRFENSTFSRS